MVIGACELHLAAHWVNSLKEKRKVLKSIVEKSKNKFNISVAVTKCQDVHKTIVLGFSCVSNSHIHANSIIDNVINYIENNCEAVIENIEIEIY